MIGQPEGATCSLWEHLLRGTGFNGINIEFHDSSDIRYRSMSVITSTVKCENAEYPSEIALVFAKSLPPQQWLETFHLTFSTAVPCTIHTQLLVDCDATEKVCILFDDVEEPILHQLDDQQFYALRKLFRTSKGVLWISRGATAECPNPFAALHTGLLRTLRCENTASRYVSLDLDSQVELWTHVTAEGITNVFRDSFDNSKDQSSVELEYSIRSDTTMISRLRENPQENAAVAIEEGEVEPELLPLAEIGRDIRLAVGTPGLLDSLSFRDDESVTEPLPDDFVEIAPAAFGLNFRDVMVALGQLNESRMGWECSGVVTRIGKISTAHGGYKVGDAVYACIRGHFATNVRVHYSSVHRMPIGMDFETAASIPLIFVTAYHALYNMASLKIGETVLIHSGTGGVGQAAIMLAQHIGAKIFVTVGSDEKRDFLMKKYGIPSEHIFSSRNRTFADKVMALTGGNGVDVVLNSLAGQLLRETWNCIAYFGRFIEIGKRDLELNNNLEMGPFVRSVTYASIDLIALGELRGNILSSIMKDLTALLNTKAIRAVEPLHVFPMTEAEKAFRTMTTGKHMGKIVLKPSPTDFVKVCPVCPMGPCTLANAHP
jgi:NADPH:quinone reductase-like Zn-dependent oxidoreductase